MAVIQISKIQVRRGLQENLPALDSGELGWSVDTQRLFIGKGSLAEGAPTTGVTEVLTEYSILGLNNLTGNVANLAANVTALQSNVSLIQANVYPSASTLLDNTPVATNTAITITSLQTSTIDYNIVRGTTSRVGTIKVAEFNGSAVYEDEYSETANTGVLLSFQSFGANAVLQYVTSSTGSNAVFTYYTRQFIV